jgi:hypothetical protein
VVLVVGETVGFAIGSSDGLSAYASPAPIPPASATVPDSGNDDLR